MISVIILGSGNVAKHMYTALGAQKSIEVVQCYNRKGILLNPEQDSKIITQDLNDLVKVDVYILAVSDDAIEEISSKLPFNDCLVVHTSGSVPLKTIKNNNRRGVFYPLQTFSKDKVVDFSKIPFCLEAEEEKDLVLLNKLASSLSEKIYQISSEQRNILHISAVFVNNFTNYLFSVGNDICEEHKVPFEILHPLIQETAKKITNINPDQAQTGPAIRNDITTIDRHLHILNNTQQKELYQTLTKAIQSKHGKKL
ncbi:DUF2520 domain-containing protein [Aquimarina sp. MMG016]|uniref:Rossmann-like and DUF2520 domain-containing protein n=1 Tax=Aquimarina sp. MMG016 TaxID=2822690 RepID=UPI001B3A4831|nr:DUF2520 domain-containing protein [Aquimarina sp. MMG016]MBQ4821312.1 DUF2520 domain-containing protein [Aquimarina sp. MMG016]